MAIDNTTVAVQAADDLVTAVTQICNALDKIETIKEHLTDQAVPINLSDFEAYWQENAPSLKHIDAVTLKNIMTSFAPGIISAMKALYDGSPTQQCWAAFMKARR